MSPEEVTPQPDVTPDPSAVADVKAQPKVASAKPDPIEPEPFSPEGEYLMATIKMDKDGDGAATVGMFANLVTAITNEDGTVDLSDWVSVIDQPGTTGIAALVAHGDPNTSTIVRIYYH